jgi:hypothetical protein
VVGDSAQLPPADDAESLLAACLRAGLPRRELSWHYRSQDEALIAFSNTHSYADRLSSFPAPTAGGAISLLPARGTFLRSGPGARTNPVEAQVVVAEVLRRLQHTAVPSIGVVTLNGAQRSLIESLLRDSGDPRVAEALERTDGEGLVVKTVDDVQGDERDVVLLSLGASPDAFGRLPLDLGPLGRRGGERWLNVAVTRARRQVVVVASFAPEQLRAEDTSAVGIAHLRAYLDAAAQEPAPAPRTAVDRHRDEIAEALRGRGLVVRTDVGLSRFRLDLTVAPSEAPDAPLLAVLLDGPDWAGRPTVGDRDGLPAEVLTELRGWPAVERVWLPAWLAGRADVLDRLVATIDAAAAALAPEPKPVVEPEEPYDGPLAEVIPLRPSPAVVVVEEPIAAPEPVAVVPEPVAVVATEPEPVAVEPEPEPEPVEPEPEPVEPEPVAVEPEPVAVEAEPARSRTRKPAEVAEPLDEELPFIAWAPRTAGEKKQLDQLSDPAVARVVRRVLAAGLKAEGPIHRDRLARLTAGAFGLTRVTDARRDALLALLPRTAGTAGEFVWPGGLDRATWSWFRRQATAAERPLEHVAPEEIGNAMVALARANADLTKVELYQRTVELFGSRRRTPAQTPLLDAAFAALRTAGRPAEQPDGPEPA